jgi:hypothetical protein
MFGNVVSFESFTAEFDEMILFWVVSLLGRFGGTATCNRFTCSKSESFWKTPVTLQEVKAEISIM